jgi:PAS domain S-box-containing protein
MTTPDRLLISTYDYRLVVLSVVIAILAAYAALDLAGRVTSARGRVRFAWLSGGAMAMGTGIWSMHYIGMLAFQLPIPVLYDWPTVLVSLLAAIFASAIALFVASRRRMGLIRASIGSIFMGGGIATMHYTGMAAMRLSATCQWSPSLVTLSVVLAVVISFVALLLTFYFREEMSAWSWRKISSAVLMGAAIPVMHYTGMAAASFSPSAAAMGQWNTGHTVSAASLSAAGVSVVTFMILGFAVLTSLAHRRFSVQAVELEASGRYQQVIETSLDAFVGIDSNGLIMDWNQQAEATFGWSRAEAIGQALSHLIIPQRYREAHQGGLQRYLATGEGPVLNKRIEITGLHRRGHEFPVELMISPVRWRGTCVFAAFVRDITERKEAGRRVQAQLQRLNLLHQITRAIGGREDLKSIYQVVLRSLEEHLSFDFGCMCDYDATRQELTVVNVGIGSQPLALELTLTEQAHIPIDANGLGRCVQGQLVYEPDITDVKLPFPERLTRAGLNSVVAAPLLVESKVFGVFLAARRKPHSFSSADCEFLRQVTEHAALAAHQAQLHASLQQAYDDLRQTQQAVMQQERLRALGQMASGIAHDINNAISPMVLSTELLLEKDSNLSPQTRKHLEMINRCAEDVAKTVDRMREFYRRREPQLTLFPVQLNALVQQVVDLTRARWSDIPQQQGVVIELRTEFAQGLPAIMGVESEIREALTNLIFNAVDAMPTGGTLTLRTRLTRESLDSAQPVLRSVAVEVVDTGLGMDDETRRRCLEPFFTTKGERGTGLGLAMVYGMAQRHSADIEIESTVNMGTTVRLTFCVPVTVGTYPAEAQVAPAVLPRLRILVVDDDPLLLKTLCEILESDGHEVVTANGGQAGIDAFGVAKLQGREFAVVITDLGMPRVDGRKVAAFVKSASKTTPVILLTGWGQRLVAEGDIPLHVDRVLAKPPKLRDLREALWSYGLAELWSHEHTCLKC